MPLANAPRPNRVVICVNPGAGARGSRHKVDRLVQRLSSERYLVEVATDLGAASDLAEKWHTTGALRALVAAGGDGTVAELVNRTQIGLPITTLPLGTENLLARNFAISADPDDLCRTVMHGRLVRLDAGRASGRVFVIMIGCGFDAEVVRRLHGRRQGHISRWSYARPIVQAIRNYQYPELRLYWADANGTGAGESLCASWAFLFNLPVYGGGLRIAPHAIPDDGLLDLCAFRHGTFVHGLRYLGHVIRGSHHRLADCTTARLARVRIESHQEVPFQLDGDPGGFLPLDVEVLAGRLCLLIPAVGERDAKANQPAVRAEE